MVTHMKYTLEIDLDLPRERVIELFDDPDNLPKWQPGLISFEHASGEPGQPGAKTRLKYVFGKREIDMAETIEARNLPDEFTAIYEAKGAWNRVENRFVETGPSQAKWIFDTEFRCGGMLKVMAFFMPGMFKRSSIKDMQRFKAFAESQDGAGQARPGDKNT